jgi:hypothetical protein
MNEHSTINRIAVTLIPTEACLDWINAHDEKAFTLDDIRRDPTVFLLPQGRDEPEGQVRRHFKEMFLEELNSWYTDPDMWPKDLSFKTFKKFFMVHVSSMVLDLGKGQIVKESED